MGGGCFLVEVDDLERLRHRRVVEPGEEGGSAIFEGVRRAAPRHGHPGEQRHHQCNADGDRCLSVIVHATALKRLTAAAPSRSRRRLRMKINTPSANTGIGGAATAIVRIVPWIRCTCDSMLSRLA